MIIGFLPLSLLILAGCSGSDGVPEKVGAAEISLGSIPTMLVVDLDEASNVLALTGGARSARLSARSTFDSSGFEGYYDDYGGGEFIYASLGETSTGSGRAITFVSGPDLLNGRGSKIERIGETAVPDSGTARYLGSYIGWLSLNEGSLRGQVQISGDVALDANFATASIDGSITNRRDNIRSDGATFGDVTIVATSIVGGGFAGITSGGASNTAGSTASNGEYAGMLTGPDAQEVVGAIQIPHAGLTTTYTETGVFIAE